MAKAEIQETLAVSRDRLYSVITQYEDYPKFVEGCKEVNVKRNGSGETRVTYHVSMIKDISYTLDHREDGKKNRLEWNLVESDFMKSNTGFWELKDLGNGKTEIRYGVEIEFKFPVPSLILNRLIKGSLPAMVKSFEKRALAAK